MDCFEKVKGFYERYQGEKRVIGKSVFNREIYAVKLGDGNPVGIVQYALHGREYITSTLALSHCKYGGVTGSVWIVPLANPDGVLLSQTGLYSAPSEYRKELLRINGGENFLLWKANGRAVDLNVNFDAKWGQGTKNVRVLASENYIGPYPFSEPETIALRDFTYDITPDYTLSFHTKGEEIYFGFGKSINGETEMAKSLSLSTGYPLKTAVGSVGGYKDWCIEKLSIPSFTIEVGKDEFSHPLGEESYQDIERKNIRVLADLSKSAAKVLKR